MAVPIKVTMTVTGILTKLFSVFLTVIVNVAECGCIDPHSNCDRGCDREDGSDRLPEPGCETLQPFGSCHGIHVPGRFVEGDVLSNCAICFNLRVSSFTPSFVSNI